MASRLQTDDAPRFEPFAKVVGAGDPTPAHELDCAAPPAAPLEVTFEALGVEKTSAGERLVLELDVDGTLTGHIRGRYAFELVDDTGRAVQAASESPVFAFTSGHGQTFRISTPTLADGFYIARVTVVADNGVGQDSAVRQVLIESRGGDVNPVDDAVFNARSRAKEGHR